MIKINQINIFECRNDAVMLGINRKYVSGYSSVDDISITQETKIVKKKKVIKKLIVAKFCTGAGYQRDFAKFQSGTGYQ